MPRYQKVFNAAFCALALLGLTALPAAAQESCDDALAWTRGLAIRIGQSRSQTEMDLARSQARQQRLDVEVQQLREEIARLKTAEPKKEK